jgi:hypothetical protein
MECPECHSSKIQRIKRKGFFQTRLAPLFGYYPWHCSECRKDHLLKVRGERKRLRSKAGRSRRTSGQSESHAD